MSLELIMPAAVGLAAIGTNLMSYLLGKTSKPVLKIDGVSMSATHQYCAYLKTYQPEFWEELVADARGKLDDPDNYRRSPNGEKGREFEDAELIKDPHESILNEYRLIDEEDREFFTPEFLDQVKQDQIAQWVVEEADADEIRTASDRFLIEEAIDFLKGFRSIRKVA